MYMLGLHQSKKLLGAAPGSYSTLVLKVDESCPLLPEAMEAEAGFKGGVRTQLV